MALNAADAWQQGGRGDRPIRAARADRALAAQRPPRPRSAVPARGRSADHPRERRADYSDDDAQAYSRPPVPRRTSGTARSSGREYPSPRREPRGGAERRGRRTAPPQETGNKLRGFLAVLGVFLITLAAAGIESFVSTGLGIITQIGLVASSVAAAWLVRRHDLFSVIVCPPLVFTAVAAVNMVAAPSVHFTGIKAFGLLALTLLVRAFPTMAIATGAATVVGLVRLAQRR